VFYWENYNWVIYKMMFIEELKPNLNLQSKSILVGDTFLFYFILFIFLNTWLYIIRHWHHKHQKMMGRTECSVHYFCQYSRGAHDYADQVPFVVNHAPVAQLVEYRVVMREVVNWSEGLNVQSIIFASTEGVFMTMMIRSPLLWTMLGNLEENKNFAVKSHSTKTKTYCRLQKDCNCNESLPISASQRTMVVGHSY